MAMMDLIIIKTKELKKTFTEVYGSVESLETFEGPEYNIGIYLNDTNVYVHDCIFRNCVSTYHGGAIFCSSNVNKLLIEQTSFISCKTLNSTGGAICFPIIHQCVLSKICAFNCSSTCNGYSSRQFAYIAALSNVNNKNHIKDSSIAHTLMESSYSAEIINLALGTIICQSDNISNNECSVISAISCRPAQYGSSTISYSSIVNNTAIEYACLYFDAYGGVGHYIYTCNILNNEQYSSQNGAIVVEVGSSIIKNSCILRNNKEKVVFCKKSDGYIDVSNCTIDNDSYSGTVRINKTIEQTFFNPLSHIITEICDYYYGEYWNMTRYKAPPTMTPITLSPTLEYEHVSTSSTLEYEHVSISSTLEYEPNPTWDGEWAEEPEVIIKDDYPIIKETHYPIQTGYVLTSVPAVIVVTNISVGAIVISVVIVISVYNFIHTAKKLKKLLNNGKYDADVNSEEYVGLTSFSEYSK
jgi:hypothetical protein